VVPTNLDFLLGLLRVFADVWWEEEVSVADICRVYLEKRGRIWGRTMDGDPYAYQLVELESKLRELQIRCPIPRVFDEVVYKLVEEAYLALYSLRDPDLPPSELARLRAEYAWRLLEAVAEVKHYDARTRITAWLQFLDKPSNLLPREALEAVGRYRVELKIVLKPKDALKLVKKHGPKWKETIRKNVERQIAILLDLESS